ncbi:PIN domain-containing protein [Paenibacillus alkaliterrae]|uniref:PIN domain-containing protein n=1 Tax=Paenibacillus alkaliterrae TaxID=320909 RepID=UPI001F30B271|nr:PIN domain-containing protein [Paenibacillus alkaliterrae]MCF2939598.1 PIN domain-containing protein [Paenibacillus alkaliterrae]
MIKTVVLDASALLALLYKEPGHDAVSQHMHNLTVLSAVNLAEVIGKTQHIGLSSDQLMPLLQLLGIQVFDLNASLAVQIGLMRAVAKPFGLSLGDLACLTLGKHLACPVLTADRAWIETDFGVEIILIRP